MSPKCESMQWDGGFYWSDVGMLESRWGASTRQWEHVEWKSSNGIATAQIDGRFSTFPGSARERAYQRRAEKAGTSNRRDQNWHLGDSSCESACSPRGLHSINLTFCLYVHCCGNISPHRFFGRLCLLCKQTSMTDIVLSTA
jgi:hypothetical protein